MRFEVTEADTAVVVGSGDVPVLATPRLIAWMEAATVHCANTSADTSLAAGQTTVGTAVRVEHRRPSVVGDVVEITACRGESTVDRRITFAVRAVDGAGQVVAVGEIDRAVVDRERFVSVARGRS